LPTDYKKILIIRFSSLGDVILTTPLLKVLREKFPNTRIDFLTRVSYMEVLVNNSNIDNIIAVSDELPFSELKEIKNNLRKEKYDLVIDLHNNLRTFYLRNFLKLSGSRILIFRKYSIRKKLLVRFKLNLMKDLPSIIDRYILTLKKLFPVDEYLNKYLPEIFTDEKSKNNVDRILSKEGIGNDKELICIVPSSIHFTKTYPPELYEELIDHFDAAKYNFVLVGTGEAIYNIDVIKTGIERNVFNLYNKFNTIELAELMKRCSYVITGDTGPMHIAEAMNVPVIMMAGSSVREFGFYPQNKNAIVLEVNYLKCRPCSHIGRSECPLVHFKCMREITPAQIQLRMKIEK